MSAAPATTVTSGFENASCWRRHPKLDDWYLMTNYANIQVELLRITQALKLSAVRMKQFQLPSVTAGDEGETKDSVKDDKEEHG